tara:strand:- start:651 stop:2429 length:1779 start_codon:yes stop_codon:yes gene_type:complete
MSKEAAAEQDYRNKFVWNQRGGAIEINNSTNREAVNISHFSGSNVKINNQVNSELASNNKQIKVNNDSFETVLNDKNVYTGKDYIERVVENTYKYKGFNKLDEIDAAEEWKELYRPIAQKNSQFEILRGGKSYPNGGETPQAGGRAPNPTINQEHYVINDNYPGYGSPPIVGFPGFDVDEVTPYLPVSPVLNTGVLLGVNPTIADINEGSGPGGYASNADGVIKYGPGVNAATEEGEWAVNPAHQNLPQDLLALQGELNPVEQRMGNGGDEEEFTYRNKLEVVGAATNDYPSVRIDPEGRSQPSEVNVGIDTSYVNVDSVPHVEEVDNSSAFPVGNYTLNVGNKYDVVVGSGGIQLKTSGAVEIGGTTLKVSAHKINLQSAAGVNISSENIVELQSAKTIALRSNRQVLIEPGLGVKNNTIIGGSTYIEGETYLHHVTAPAEVQQTEETILFSKLMKGLEFKCKIKGLLGPLSELINGTNATITVKSDSNAGFVEAPPHSHHFKNLPLRLTDGNQSVRTIAQGEGININGYQAAAKEVHHEKKEPVNTPDPPRALTVTEAFLDPHDRTRLEPRGQIKPEPPDVPKDGTSSIS